MTRGTLNKAKMERLNQIGFHWRITVIKGVQINPQIAKMQQWNENFRLLASIKDCTGTCSVPASNRNLSKWVDRQRTEMNKGKLSMEKQEKLNTISFQWKPTIRKASGGDDGSCAVAKISENDSTSEGASVHF
jgi:hypothetical protein